MPKRILAIDDEQRWLDNFRRLIPRDLAEQHSAGTTEEAIRYLRRYHYDVVLLDLSMAPPPQEDRSNQGIQNYLATRPEGTAYIIVSATVRVTEAVKAAYAESASLIVLKPEIDSEVLLAKIQQILEEQARLPAKFAADARVMLLEDTMFETQLLSALGIGGAQSFTQMLDTVLHRITPLARHLHRPPKLVIRNRMALALVWSRQRGKAVSLSFANVSVPAEEQARELAEWLGYDERQPEIEEKVYYKKVRVQCFAEPNAPEEQFDLPKISLT